MKLNKRLVALLVSLALLLTAALGSTVAYIIDRTEELNNTFTPSRVACEVIEEPGQNYTVKNTGDTTAYIRVSILVNWKNGDGHIYAKAPEFSVTLGDGWKQGSDGYYYYTGAVAPDEQILEKFAITVNATAPNSEHTLFVQVVASAIQATSAAVKDWSNNLVTIGADNKLTGTWGP